MSNGGLVDVVRQRGAALLEMAILTPLLIIVLFGVVEFGRALLQANTLTKAVTTGARYVARIPGAVTSGCAADNSTGVWETAVEQAALLIANAEVGTGSVVLPGLDDEDAIDIEPRSQSMSYQDSDGNTVTRTVCVIRVRAAAPFVALSGDSLVPFFQVGPITLNAQAEERYIGE